VCQAGLAAAGLGDDEVGLPAPPGGSRRAPAAFVAAGCARERVSGPAGLCRAHDDQRRCHGVEVDAFVAHPDTVDFPALGACLVAACPRQRRHRAGCYCEAHQLRLRQARRADPAFDEGRWRRTEPAVNLGGQVSLRGLDRLVVAQVLYRLSQRCGIERVQTRQADLRAVVDDLRRQQVSSLSEHDYERGGALAYLAAWDVHRGKVLGRTEDTTGIEPFGRLVEQVMGTEPYASAERVFWVVDNGSSHRGQASIDRLEGDWPTLRFIHTPVHASWLNQISVYRLSADRRARIKLQARAGKPMLLSRAMIVLLWEFFVV